MTFADYIPGFSFVRNSSIAWRFPIALQILFALLILAFITRLPESPRWLILKDRNDEALEVLCALNDMPPESEDIKSELAGIRAANAEMSRGSFRDLFTMNEDRHFHRTVLAYVNQMFQQISGVNLITYYAGELIYRIKPEPMLIKYQRQSSSKISVYRRSSRVSSQPATGLSISSPRGSPSSRSRRSAAEI